MAGPGSVKSGRNFRFYLNGLAVGTVAGTVATRVQNLKSSTSRGLDKVLEVGNPNVVEYVQKVPETTLSFKYAVIDYKQFAIAAGQTLGGNGSVAIGEVPDLPSNFDIVERLIVPGTEDTANEQYQGFAIYQGISFEKDDFDVEVDKMVTLDTSAKCKRPRRFVGVNGINTNRFVGDGTTKTFTLSNLAIKNSDGYYTIRVESPLTYVLQEGVDFTVASTSSTTALTFVIAPPSSTAGAATALAVYAW